MVNRREKKADETVTTKAVKLPSVKQSTPVRVTPRRRANGAAANASNVSAHSDVNASSSDDPQSEATTTTTTTTAVASAVNEATSAIDKELAAPTSDTAAVSKQNGLTSANSLSSSPPGDAAANSASSSDAANTVVNATPLANTCHEYQVNDIVW